MRIALCILVRNEAECLNAMLPRIKSQLLKTYFHGVFAIDGGSTDGTNEILFEHGIQVISQKKRGRGAAVLQAFAEIDADAYLFFSPDGNEDEKDFWQFHKLLSEGNDLVIGTRMAKGGRNEEDRYLFKPRKWVNNMFNVMANVFFRRAGPYITDSINGYRAITRKAANSCKLSAEDYTIEYQMTIRAFKNRLKVCEFPTIEDQRLAGMTGAPSFETGVQFIKRLYYEVFGLD